MAIAPRTLSPPGQRKRLWNERTLTIVLFLLPTFAFLALFVVWPILNTLQLSFYRWNGIDPTRTFTGLTNWSRLLGDAVFWKALGNNLIVVVLSIVIQLPIAMLLAVMLERSKTFLSKFFKTIYFFPMLMSSVAVGILFKYIYDPSFGLINETLRRFGLDALAQSWLGDPRFALLAIILVICWQFIPFYMILFYAALNTVPGELKDAAQIDGADDNRYYRYIAVPMVMGTVRTAIILSLIGSLKYFDLVWVMTEGGPNNASELMATYMYKKAFPSFDVGYGSTVAFAMFIFVLFVSLVAQTLSRRADYRRAA
jgi:raffinose/stachyose/melibiose transport system permease protein